MSSINDYIQIMIDSLKKKSIILDRIINSNLEQSELLAGKTFDEVDWDRFNLIVTDKEIEIDHINEMDAGFQSLYDRVGEQLKKDRHNYTEQIKTLQALITELEEKSVIIRTGEERNRATIEKIVTGRKSEIKQNRTSLKAASSYYKAMQKNFLYEANSLDTTK